MESDKIQIWDRKSGPVSEVNNLRKEIEELKIMFLELEKKVDNKK